MDDPLVLGQLASPVPLWVGCTGAGAVLATLPRVCATALLWSFAIGQVAKCASKRVLKLCPDTVGVDSASLPIRPVLRERAVFEFDFDRAIRVVSQRIHAFLNVAQTVRYL